jgi:hypothetical protein
MLLLSYSIVKNILLPSNLCLNLVDVSSSLHDRCTVYCPLQTNEPHEDGDQELSDAESRVGDTSMENPVMGWTMKLQIMVPKADIFFHDVLTRTLDTYYYDWEATLEYR